MLRYFICVCSGVFSSTLNVKFRLIYQSFISCFKTWLLKALKDIQDESERLTIQLDKALKVSEYGALLKLCPCVDQALTPVLNLLFKSLGQKGRERGSEYYFDNKLVFRSAFERCL